MPVTIILGGKPKFYADKFDMGTWGRAGNPDISHDVVDVAAWDNNAHRSRPGLQTVTFSFNALFDSDASASHDMLLQMRTTAHVISHYMDGDGTGSVGIGMGSAKADSYQFGGNVGDREEVTASIYQDGTYDRLFSLGSRSTYTTAADAAIQDGPVVQDQSTASSTAGGFLYLHSFSASGSGGNKQFLIRFYHSSVVTSNQFASLAEVIVGSAVASGTRVTIGSGVTIRRYVRTRSTLDGSSGFVSFQAAYARNPVI